MTWTFQSHAYKCKIKFTNRVPLSASSSGSNEACIILIKLYFLLKCSVVDLGLSPLGEDTGTADALAQLILQSMTLSNITLSDAVKI